MLHALTFLLAAASAPHYPDLLHAGTYHYTFEGSFWNGEKRAFAADETLARDGDAVTLRVTRSGEAQRDARADERGPYDDIAGIIGAAPAALQPGAAWKATVVLQTGSSADSTTPVALDVRVARTDANGTLLQASGTAHAIAISGQYRNPIDVTVRASLLVRDGTLLRCDEEVTDYVHAGPLSQEMHWRWSLVRTS
jgi:hypothetical protein